MVYLSQGLLEVVNAANGRRIRARRYLYSHVVKLGSRLGRIAKTRILFSRIMIVENLSHLLRSKRQCHDVDNRFLVFDKKADTQPEPRNIIECLRWFRKRTHRGRISSKKIAQCVK